VALGGHEQKEFAFNNQDHLWAAFYTLLSMITRYWKIGKSPSVVWDEVRWRLSVLARPKAEGSLLLISSFSLSLPLDLMCLATF
jgi:hypothetical protein